MHLHSDKVYWQVTGIVKPAQRAAARDPNSLGFFMVVSVGKRRRVFKVVINEGDGGDWEAAKGTGTYLVDTWSATWR